MTMKDAREHFAGLSAQGKLPGAILCQQGDCFVTRCACAGLVKQTDTEEEDFQEVDGTLIGPGGFAVTDDGVVISASKLTVLQLKAELKARGLSSEGKRVDLYRRVQASSLRPSDLRVARKRSCVRTSVSLRGGFLGSCPPPTKSSSSPPLLRSIAS